MKYQKNMVNLKYLNIKIYNYIDIQIFIMDVLIQQAPSNLTIDEIEMVYNKNNNDMIKTLEELWGIIDNTIEQPKTKWDDIRETCDAYDFEMQKVMKRVKK